MDRNLKQIKNEVYETCGLQMSNFLMETESKEYDACRFELSDRKIISRNSKITPKKVGQLVTFWKRNINGIIEPLEETDGFDFFIVNVRTEKEYGQFVFPKSVLILKGIISTAKKGGKRAFRVYPGWDVATNNQAVKTQKWQLDYFYEINDSTDFKKVANLYKICS